MKIKFNVKFYDKKEGVLYIPSDLFVDAPNHVVERLKEREKELNVKGEYEYEQPTATKKPTKSKLSD